MVTKTIPQRTITYCDICGESSENRSKFRKGARMSVKQAGLDFRGDAVCDGTWHHDLCDRRSRSIREGEGQMNEIDETSILDFLRDRVPKPEMPRWFLGRWSWVKVNERFVLALYPDQLIEKSFMNALFGSMNRDRARILKSDIKSLRRV